MNNIKLVLLGITLGLIITMVIQFSVEDADASTLDYPSLWDSLSDAGGLNPSNTINEALFEKRILVSTHDINARTSRQLVESMILLEQQNPGEPITLYLRTEGGWEADAFSIIQVMRHITSPVTIIGMGDVHSSGVMILAGATGDRLVYPDTILGYHAPYPDDDETNVSRYISYLKAETSLPREWLTKRNDEFLRFTAQQAVDYGVADRIIQKESPRF